MPNRSISHQVAGFIGWLVVSFAAAAVGAIASIRAADFYQQLVRPAWAPPAGLFGPVWTGLYLLMAVAAWIIWRDRGWRDARTALVYFIGQLAANALWSWLFFKWHLGFWASVEIFLLWGLIAKTVIRFWEIRPLAGILLLPYLAWVTFAIGLCVATWRLNPVALGGAP